MRITKSGLDPEPWVSTCSILALFRGKRNADIKALLLLVVGAGSARPRAAKTPLTRQDSPRGRAKTKNHTPHKQIATKK